MEKKPNRLIKEKSPYLLQHAYNPIDWHPWDNEAFEKAKREDKPVFLSIGYSCCHWCHVMERESFEDHEVADVLNQHFIAIKVDREERPDVDHIYMSVCQRLTGQGGWPLTIMMTPDKKPFFAGTYFPKENKWGRPGLVSLLATVAEQWTINRETLVTSSDRITRIIDIENRRRGRGELGAETLDRAYEQLERYYDDEYGGFGSAPKFPTPHNLMFLLRYWKRTGICKALEMVEKTLLAMYAGGIYDHIGYGFARYSTDNRWLVPHFEKMLYDNALLCYAYLEAYQCTGNSNFARIAEEIIAYVLRDMTSNEGGFYSAEDADSEGEEGKFYVWRRQEVMDILGPAKGKIFCDFYDISEEGNFEHGTSIPNTIKQSIKQYTDKYEITTEDFLELIRECRELLYTEREKRVHPFKDDKILTAWNALMVAAMAKAARVLDKKEYLTAAEKTLVFLQQKLIRQDGRVLARFRDGEAAFPAYLDDYAFLLWAWLEIYEASFNPDYLVKAVELSREMRRLFWDEKNGGFFFYGSDGENLIIRPKEVYDGAIPSGNSVAAHVLLKLARITEDPDLSQMAERQLSFFAGEVDKHPRAYTYFLIAVDYHLSVPQHIIIAGEKNDPSTQSMLRTAGSRFLPYAVVLFSDPRQKQTLAELSPLFEDKVPSGGKTAAYICQDMTCQAPITDVHIFEQSI